MEVKYELELDYGPEDDDDPFGFPLPSTDQIETWVAEGMRRDGVTPATVSATRR